MIKERFQGVYAALMTPYDRKGRVDIEMVERLVEAQGKAGHRGFYLCGNTGEGLLLNEKERTSVVKAAIRAAGKDKNIIAHVGHISTDIAVSLAEEAEKSGAHAISSMSPIHYPVSNDGVFEHYRIISTSTCLPFFGYIVPSLTGFNITTEFAKKLIMVKNFAGFKYTSFDLFRIPSILKILGNKGIIFTGSDELSFQGLTFGVVGSIGTNQNIIPAAFVKIYNLFRSGNMEGAIKLQREVNEVTLFLLSFNKAITPHKFIMKLLGFDIGNPRHPLEKLSLVEERKLRSFFEKNRIIKKYGLKG